MRIPRHKQKGIHIRVRDPNHLQRVEGHKGHKFKHLEGQQVHNFQEEGQKVDHKASHTEQGHSLSKFGLRKEYFICTL